MELRVVHVVEAYAGGCVKVVHDLINGMPSLDGVTIRHTVVHGNRPEGNPNPREGLSDDIELISWPYAEREIRPLKDFKAFLSLRRILASQSYDVIHLHSSKAGILGRALAALWRQSDRVVYTPHGVATLRQDVSARTRRMYALMESCSSKLGGVVVACSLNESRALQAVNVPSVVIPNGVAQPKPASGKPPGFPEAPTVVCVGRITAQKGPSIFMEMVRKVSRTHPDARFVWVGDGELRHELDESLVQVTGWITQDQVMAYLQAADLYVSTALWEGLPLAVLQAMACGRAMVLSQCVGNKDLVDDPAAFAQGFDSADDAARLVGGLLSDTDRRLSMGEAARTAYHRSYTTQAMCRAYGELYFKVAGTARPQA